MGSDFIIEALREGSLDSYQVVVRKDRKLLNVVEAIKRAQGKISPGNKFTEIGSILDDATGKLHRVVCDYHHTKCFLSYSTLGMLSSLESNITVQEFMVDVNMFDYMRGLFSGVEHVMCELDHNIGKEKFFAEKFVNAVCMYCLCYLGDCKCETSVKALVGRVLLDWVFKRSNLSEYTEVCFYNQLNLDTFTANVNTGYVDLTQMVLAVCTAIYDTLRYSSVIMFSDKQKELISFGRRVSSFNIADAELIMHVSNKTAHKVLQSLIDLGFVSKTGDGRSTRYLLVDN